LKRSIFKTTLAFFLEETRDFNSAIWIYIFPILLLTILVSIFSNIGQPGKMKLDVGLICGESNGLGSQILMRAFEQLSTGEDGIILLHRFSELEEAIEAMKKRQVVAVVEIPDDFDRDFVSALLKQRMGQDFESAILKIHTIPGKETSQLALQILQSITGTISDRMDANPDAGVVEYELVESSTTFRYVDWIVPGIVLMALMTVGLFGVGTTLVYMRRKGLLKRLRTTPLTNAELTFSLLASRGLIMAIQVVVICLYAVWILKADRSHFDWQFFLWTAFSGVVVCSMGTAIASLVKSLEGVEVVTNTLNWVLMFLSGLYFPVFGVPWVVRWIVYISPITYLAEGYRGFYGLSLAPYPRFLNLLVPTLWTIFFLVVTITRFRWSEEV